jgi:hypothetical protein
MKSPLCLLVTGLLLTHLTALELHVATTGKDSNPGTAAAPLLTIQAAANRAQPGDVITVHAGTYRERVNPPRGGLSDAKRIIYQAAPGEKVEIKGSEIVKGWVKVENDTWKTTLPNSFFGTFNPYRDVVQGDWFDPIGRVHHTGAVYIKQQRLTETEKLDEVLKPAGDEPLWHTDGGGEVHLMNIAWLRPGAGTGDAGRVAAGAFAAQRGIQRAACSEGGECIGWISEGDWVRYGKVDFGKGTSSVEVRASSPNGGGRIELRLDKADGELLGTCEVANTGDWQKWDTFTAKIKPTRGVQSLCMVFRPQPSANENGVTLWAQFKGIDPNQTGIEINARQTVFYPDQPGRNFITVRGFTMAHAATPWAPPTSEQIGLIGTHWSKGWIIENNHISHSICTGITLGKYGDEFDNTSANSADGYLKTIERARTHRIAWTKENIGHHKVRNNTISDCEQAGVVGSLGAVFSEISGNHIFNIWVKRRFQGAEMGGIKFHAAIDMLIRNNRIHNTGRAAIWLDWMAQGTRVTGNLCYDNRDEDLFVEVDHGPLLADNNIFLSPVGINDQSEGSAFVHNLIHGSIASVPDPYRSTPYHKAHSTVPAGQSNIPGGDSRYYNNLFAAGKKPGGLWVYNDRPDPLQTGGNLYDTGVRPYAKELTPAVHPAGFKPSLIEEGGHVYLKITIGKEIRDVKTSPVTTESLGKPRVCAVPYDKPDGSPLTVDIDYAGAKRKTARPTPGPFANLAPGQHKIQVW